MASCHFKTSERRQHHTEVTKKHDRRLHLHHVGHGDVLFLSTQLTELNGHCRPKIQTHESCCREAKNEHSLGKGAVPFVCQGEAAEEENTSHNITTYCDIHQLQTHCACVRFLHAFFFHYVQLLAASFIGLIPLFKHYDV